MIALYYSRWCVSRFLRHSNILVGGIEGLEGNIKTNVSLLIANNGNEREVLAKLSDSERHRNILVGEKEGIWRLLSMVLLGICERNVYICREQYRKTLWQKVIHGKRGTNIVNYTMGDRGRL